MKLNLVNKLGEFTKKLKINEEEYMTKYKELVGDEVKYTSSLDSKSNLRNLNGSTKSLEQDPRKGESFLKIDTSNNILQKRDDEINTLVNSITELASIFKDLQTLVLEQGTILDRIDYNIEHALRDTQKATVDLARADKNMKSNCARNANLILLIVIFVLSCLLVMKFF